MSYRGVISLLRGRNIAYKPFFCQGGPALALLRKGLNQRARVFGRRASLGVPGETQSLIEEKDQVVYIHRRRICRGGVAAHDLLVDAPGGRIDEEIVQPRHLVGQEGVHAAAGQLLAAIKEGELDQEGRAHDRSPQRLY